MLENKKIIILAKEGIGTNIIFNALKKDYGVEKVVLEDPLKIYDFLKQRVKKIGWWQVFGQILFYLIIVKLLNLVSRKRKEEIMKESNLDDSPISERKTIRIESVNSKECLELLRVLNPDLIIVSGTRIISDEILKKISCPFVNLHTGITPKYRGVHGGYWAIANGDLKNCGVTIHLIDRGIDTGGILHQGIINVTPKDNFATYIFLQYATGIPLLLRTISEILGENYKIKPNWGGSRLWYHPTFWIYFKNLIFKGVK